MPLEAGKILGPYEILSPIGAGGMGEVYKARDTRLERIVAIKVLPEHVASDPDLKQRFEREARTVAALNHPHICTLHDIGSQDGVDFLVMEYLDGQTVAQRLEKGALPLDQALQIAIDIADALDKAHRQGIVHRDLKPANIMLTKVGAKLLDFGLAKLKPLDQAGGLSALPTQPADLTQQGAILGTFQYMAPEQLEGQEADARTDIFAFGAVVYEMVTGTKAFEGKSQASLIGAILHTDPPPLTEVQPITPLSLDRVVRKCLRKDPEDRWQTARDVATELISRSDSAGPPPEAKHWSWARSAAIAILGIAVGALIAGTFQRQQDVPVVGDTQRLSISLVEKTPVAMDIGGYSLAVSPDGRSIAYTGIAGGVPTIFLRNLDTYETRQLADRGHIPFFSPDGQWVGFFTSGTLYKVSVVGGDPIRLCDTPPLISAAWGPDDTIVFGSTQTGLFQVSAAGGEPREITPFVDSEFHLPRQFLPNGRDVLIQANTVGGGIGDLAVKIVAVDSGEITDLDVPGGAAKASYGGGYLMFSRQDTLWAMPFDLSTNQVTGAAVPVLEDVGYNPANIAQWDVSLTGSLVYVPVASRDSVLAWVGRDGSVERLPVDPGAYFAPRLSPNGTQFTTALGSGLESDVWVFSVDGRNRRRLTDSGSASAPSWTPNGQQITYRARHEDSRVFMVQRSDGSDRPVRLTTQPTLTGSAEWLENGQSFVFGAIGPGGGDLWISKDGQEPEELLVTRFAETQPALSPNFRWLAYTSDSTGRPEVWLQGFPEAGTPVAVSRNGGTDPVWSRDGTELFFLANRQMMVARVDSEDGTILSAPEELPGPPLVARAEVITTTFFDVSLDASRFLVPLPVGTLQPGEQINVVLNWFEELKARVPTN